MEACLVESCTRMKLTVDEDKFLKLSIDEAFDYVFHGLAKLVRLAPLDVNSTTKGCG